MTSIILINKGGNIKEMKIKNLTRDKLYSKCGFKKENDFDIRTTWKLKIEDTDYNIEIWSRNVGKSGTENKYDFPPPIDNELYFGTCCLINTDKKNNIIDLTVKEWEKIYETLFGGFEDLVSEEESEDELTKIPDKYKTSEGYLKDGFVVDEEDTDSEISYKEYLYTDEEDEEDEEDEKDEK